MTKKYLQIDNASNTVTNIILWDGGSNWTPPEGCTMIDSATIATLHWQFNEETKDYELAQTKDFYDIGFTWDKATRTLTSNHTKPEVRGLEERNGEQTISSGLKDA